MKLVWWGVIGLSVVAMVRVWWVWSACEGDGTQSTCSFEPVATWPIAIGVTVVAVLAITASAVMLRRKSVSFDPTN